MEDIEIPELDLSGLTIEEEATPQRTKRADAGKPRGSRRGDSALVQQLLIPWAGITLAVSGALPVTGAILENRGEPTVKALVDLSAEHPKMRAALKSVGKFGPASELAQTSVLLVIAVAMETGRIPVDNTFSRKLGITDLFYQFHPESAPQEETIQFSTNGTAPPFPYAGMTTP